MTKIALEILELRGHGDGVVPERGEAAVAIGAERQLLDVARRDSRA